MPVRPVLESTKEIEMELGLYIDSSEGKGSAPTRFWWHKVWDCDEDVMLGSGGVWDIETFSPG